MADDLSADSHASRGIDLIAGRAGAFVRGQAPYAPQSQTATATFTTPWVESSGHSDLRVDSVVAAVAGTAPSATVTIQTSFDAGVTDPARTVGSALPAQTAAGTVRAALGTLDRWVRASVVIAGSAGQSVTLSLSGELV